MKYVLLIKTVKETDNVLFLLGENSKSNKRDSSIELLRIFAGIAIIILHFNYNPAGGGHWYLLRV